jgi:hypothetical protein
MVVEMRTRFSFTPTALEQNVAPPMMAVADTAIGCPKSQPQKAPSNRGGPSNRDWSTRGPDEVKR